MSIQTESSLKPKRVSSAKANWSSNLFLSFLILYGPQFLHEGFNILVSYRVLETIFTCISAPRNNNIMSIESTLSYALHEVHSSQIQYTVEDLFDNVLGLWSLDSDE